MDEKRYPLTLPCGNESCKLTKKVTQAEARAIREQCEKIEAEPTEPKKRQWQDGDVVQRRLSGALRVRINGTWSCSGGSDLQDNGITDIDTYLFNVADVLAQGRIVVGLREDEITGGDPWVVWNKANSALAAYRQRKDSK